MPTSALPNDNDNDNDNSEKKLLNLNDGAISVIGNPVDEDNKESEAQDGENEVPKTPYVR